MKKHFFVHLVLFASLLCKASWCDPDPDTDENNGNITEDPEYDPTGRVSRDSIIITWSTGADIPVELGWSAASVIEGKFYIIGGATSTEVSNIVQIYDPGLDSWSQSDSKRGTEGGDILPMWRTKQSM